MKIERIPVHGPDDLQALLNHMLSGHGIPQHLQIGHSPSPEESRNHPDAVRLRDFIRRNKAQR